jgi:hypothetical protein
VAGCLGVLEYDRAGEEQLARVIPLVWPDEDPPVPPSPPVPLAYRQLRLRLFPPEPQAEPLPAAMPCDAGVTYLLCFRDRATGEHARYMHAGHRLGWALVLDARMRQHRAGTRAGGGRLPEVVLRAGLTWSVARIWPGTTRVWEYTLKRRGSRARLCPLCDPAGAARRALYPARTPGAVPPDLVDGAAVGGAVGVASRACELLVFDQRRAGRLILPSRKSGRPQAPEQRVGGADCWRPCGRDADTAVAVGDRSRQVCAGCRLQLDLLAGLGRAHLVRWIEPAWAAPATGTVP